MLLPVSNSKDVTAGRMVCDIVTPSGYRSPSARHVPYLCLNAGISPSYALLSMPMANFGPGAWDEIAPTCALQRSGPAGALKLRTRGIVKYSQGSVGIPMMTGWLVTHTHNRKSMEDSVITQIWDDRWVLGKYTCFGRMVYDPQIGKLYWEKTDQIFNEMGYPNCVDTPWGPMFAPCHRFGYKSDFSDASGTAPFEDYDEPAPGQATTRARSFRCQDVFQYQRNFFAAGSGGVRPAMPVDVGETTLPEEIVWPKSLGSGFRDDRALKHYSTQGQSLLHVLQNVASKAGPWDLYVEPRDNGNGVLALLDMRPKANTGVTLYTADYAANLADAMSMGTVVKSFSVTESCIDAFDDVCIMGDAPAIEFMANTYNESPGALALEPAWSDADEAAYKAYITKYGDTEFAFKAATRRWPLVFAAWRIKKSFDLWAGSKWAGKKNGGQPRIKPAQLTGYQQDSSNPRNWQPREIIVEYLHRYQTETPGSGGPWEPDKWFEAIRYDNLTLSADGTIMFLSALRDNRQSWYSRSDGVSGDGAYRGIKMEARNIRMQIAVEGDWPLTGRTGKGGGAEDDPNKVYDRMEAKPRFTWQVASEPMEYVEYLRRGDSKPVGQANNTEIGDPFSGLAFQPRLTEGNELFTDRINATSGRLPNHAAIRLPDVKRVSINGTLEIEPVSPGMRPGLSISLKGNDTISCYGVSKGVVIRDMPGNADEGQTSVIIGPPENAVLTNPPSPSYATSADNSGESAAPTPKTETPTETPATPSETPKKPIISDTPSETPTAKTETKTASETPAYKQEAPSKPAEPTTSANDEPSSHTSAKSEKPASVSAGKNPNEMTDEELDADAAKTKKEQDEAYKKRTGKDAPDGNSKGIMEGLKNSPNAKKRGITGGFSSGGGNEALAKKDAADAEQKAKTQETDKKISATQSEEAKFSQQRAKAREQAKEPQDE